MLIGVDGDTQDHAVFILKLCLGNLLAELSSGRSMNLGLPIWPSFISFTRSVASSCLSDWASRLEASIASIKAVSSGLKRLASSAAIHQA